MKKKIAIMLLTVMAVSLVACGGQDDTNTNETGSVESNVETNVEESNGNVETTPESDVVEENNGAAENEDGALGLINSVWSTYAEDEKFPVGGGDSENLSFEGAAKFDVKNTAELNSTLGFPEAEAGKIDDAASMVNAMMLNNFTMGVYHVTNADDVQTVADAIKENIMVREWMCGFPEKLYIISVDNYVVSIFGIPDFTDTFVSKLTAVYENASILYNESLEF